MTDGRRPPAALVRPEFEVRPGEAAHIGDVARPLATWERISNTPFAWHVLILVILATVWALYARWLNNPLLFPAFSLAAQAVSRSRSRLGAFCRHMRARLGPKSAIVATAHPSNSLPGPQCSRL